jgi:Kdo2-lipid IVA lauroyltransferase/acyltransferase
MSGTAKHKAAQGRLGQSSMDAGQQPKTARHWLENAGLRALMGLAFLLPYPVRVWFFGMIMRRLIAPLAGYRTRTVDNLTLIWPDMTAAEKRRLADRVSDNAGRSLIENYSTKAFTARMTKIDPTGPGVAALFAARAKGQAVILVSGHFGNYEAARASLVARGFAVGGLYRPARNSYFNDHYVRTMEAFGGPIFAQGPRGTAGFVRHLRTGGQLVLLFDQDVRGADTFMFMGRPARTATSAAALALRYNAVLLPFYATRQADGLSFALEIEAPIAASDAATMTQAMTTSLEARVRAHPEQWFWIHKRWKK